MTGLKEKSSLIREALKALIERESARRLARLGGSEPDLKAAPRRSTSASLPPALTSRAQTGFEKEDAAGKPLRCAAAAEGVGQRASMNRLKARHLSRL